MEKVEIAFMLLYLNPSKNKPKNTISEKLNWEPKWNIFCIFHFIILGIFYISGVALYFASTLISLSHKGSQPAEDTVNTVILADLLQKQAQDFGSALVQIQGKVTEIFTVECGVKAYPLFWDIEEKNASTYVTISK